MNHTIPKEEQIFLQAIDLTDVKAQCEFLAEACAGDDVLLTKIKRLVSLHGRQDNVLDLADEMAAGFDPRFEMEHDSVAEGVQLGQYKLLQKLGDGGMGVVYMAEQTEPIRRKVAIKVIKLGMASRSVIARFETERQALALMDHPNISRLHDAGVTKGGRPYFVMELITGLPITKYVVKRNLNLRQRVELFCKVCHAIQHAHQKGIIHRDIKPNNILVTEFDGQAVPKVIDFGIAKALNGPLTDKTMFTSYGNMVGTPEYMSPEQAELNGLDVDTCSDVYSLGVVLYELMTGSTPFAEHRKKGLLKFCEAICQIEPALASTRVNQLANTKPDFTPDFNVEVQMRNQYLRGDVDWILARCLSKRREDRYATVAELAADIQRHLSGEPVSAGGPGKTYRLKKLFAKHRWPILAATALLTAMVIATIVSLSFAVRANRAELLTQHHLQESLVARKEAEAERDRAVSAEKTIRELERATGFEAANAKALVRYMNQEERSSRPPKVNIEDAAPRSASILKFRVAPNGDLFVSSDDGKFSLQFVDRLSGTQLKTPMRLRIQELGPEAREQVRQVLGFVTSELGSRFGLLDLFVAEPQMMLAELEIEDENWSRAESRIRHTSLLFTNNFADTLLKAKNRLLLALILLRQDRLSREGLDLIANYHEQVSNPADTDERLRHAILAISNLVNERTSEHGLRATDDSALKLAVAEFLSLQDVLVAEVIVSMERAFDDRTQSILGQRKK